MVVVPKEHPEPGASRRKRPQNGTPAFLRWRNARHNNSKHYLGEILTVYHEIPAARNALLSSGHQADNYGNDNEWWKGRPIARPTEADTLGDRQAEFFEEIHRLMAFLDGTERSYGTGDSLAAVRAIREDWGNSTDRTFAQILQHSLEKSGNSKGKETFCSVAETISSDELVIKDTFSMLDITINKGSTFQPNNLYNALDSVFWPNVLEEDFEMEQTRTAALSELGAVVTIQVVGDGLQQPLDIPQPVYLDRYLVEHNDRVMAFQRQLVVAYRAYSRAKGLRDRFLKWAEPLSETGRIKQVWDRHELSTQVVEALKKDIFTAKAAQLWEEHEKVQNTPSRFDYSAGDVDDFTELNGEAERLAQHYEASIAIHERKIAAIDRLLKSRWHFGKSFPRRWALT
jgi:hypothetical protein